MNDSNLRICVVVVTFNRRQLLLNCIEALLNQTRLPTSIYILDNASTDGTFDALLNYGFFDNRHCLELGAEDLNSLFIFRKACFFRNVRVYFLRLSKNIGGAGGFYEGVKLGHKQKHNWFWLMDDDCLPDAECLEQLVKFSLPNIVSGPVVLDQNKKTVWLRKVFEAEWLYVKTIPFNGMFISNEVVTRIGYPIKEFFIYGDDKEYSFRAKNSGFELRIIRNAILTHPSITSNVKRTFVVSGKALLYHDEMDFSRLYFDLRNNLIIYLRYKDSKVLFEIFRRSLSYVCFSKKRFIYLRTFLRSFKDAFVLNKFISTNPEYREGV